MRNGAALLQCIVIVFILHGGWYMGADAQNISQSSPAPPFPFRLPRDTNLRVCTATVPPFVSGTHH